MSPQEFEKGTGDLQIKVTFVIFDITYIVTITQKMSISSDLTAVVNNTCYCIERTMTHKYTHKFQPKLAMFTLIMWRWED